jgi:transglutaminase/protease-like cytokinesis protein 3
MDELVADAKAEPSILKRIRMVHDWVCDNISYDFERMTLIDKHNYQLEHYLPITYQVPDYTVSDVLRNYSGVCQEYAYMFYHIAKRCGINVWYVDDQSLCHAYNIVKYKGYDYVVDCTWDAGHGQGFPLSFVYDFHIKYFMIDEDQNYALR